MSDVARDVTDATFDEEVLERSKSVPVVVDLWAPWCGPCRALTPVLERVARDADGAFELVKINVDDNPVTAQALGARSIPLVVAFKDGRPVSNFVGAQPEGAVRRFIETLVPSEVDRMVDDAARARSQGRDRDAETILTAALDNDARHEGACLALAELLGDAGRTIDALDVLAKADPSPAIDRLRSRLRVTVSGDVGIEALRERASGDVGAAIELAKALVARGDAQDALDVLLDAVQREGRGEPGPARRAMLDVFNVLGARDPLVREYRAKLARALF